MEKKVRHSRFFWRYPQIILTVSQCWGWKKRFCTWSHVVPLNSYCTDSLFIGLVLLVTHQEEATKLCLPKDCRVCFTLVYNNLVAVGKETVYRIYMSPLPRTCIARLLNIWNLKCPYLVYFCLVFAKMLVYPAIGIDADFNNSCPLLK